MLDVVDRLSVIIGGGSVAARKSAGLVEAGARRVRVVAPEFKPAEFDPSVELVRERYRPEHLDGAGLVFAATSDPGVNAAVVRDAQARGLLVCRANNDDDDPGDFSTPAMFRSGLVTITVSTGGAPALAARIRDELAMGLNPRTVHMADAMQALRPVIRSVASPADRQAIFRDLAGDAALAELECRGVDGLKQWLNGRYPHLRF